MKTYQTKYSDLSHLSKKERKTKENQFPYIPPNSTLGNLDLCGQIVSKTEQGNNIKFCPNDDNALRACNVLHMYPTRAGVLLHL